MYLHTYSSPVGSLDHCLRLLPRPVPRQDGAVVLLVFLLLVLLVSSRSAPGLRLGLLNARPRARRHASRFAERACNRFQNGVAGPWIRVSVSPSVRVRGLRRWREQRDSAKKKKKRQPSPDTRLEKTSQRREMTLFQALRSSHFVCFLAACTQTQRFAGTLTTHTIEYRPSPHGAVHTYIWDRSYANVVSMTAMFVH